MSRRFFVVLLLAVILSACAAPTPQVTQPPEPTSTPVPTSAPTPAETPTSTSLPPLSGSGGGVIAFTGLDSAHERDSAIYVMNADGSDLRSLPSPSEGWGFAPAWSPDGERIAFIVHHNDNDWSMYTVAADGSDLQQLTQGDLDHFPAWSPDGSQIAFSRNGNVWVMRVSSGSVVQASDLRQLTSIPQSDASRPVWSPDGARIAFASQLGDPRGTASYTDPSTGEIYVMNADGTDLHKLTDNAAADFTPTWSPDGAQIAFTSDRDGSLQIYVMDADGSNVRQLTQGDANNTEPAWSPDGSLIAFTSDRDGNYEIYVMNADGSNQIRLTDTPTFDLSPAWKPVP